ncbi:hypothetical protein BJY01DRAFT_226870 [Aspergillus pseudoustus]|uniref:Uncharacterized protein n=1 Tax=Aspergillus pseudoustus TaxID=1810923 RepID=A0ABR4IT49_9EURO
MGNGPPAFIRLIDPRTPLVSFVASSTQSWWCCRSTFLIRSPPFDPLNCDLTLPNCGAYPHSDASNFYSIYKQQPSPFITIVRLALIQSKIYRGLYSCAAMRQSDGELLATIQRLDSALEEW